MSFEKSLVGAHRGFQLGKGPRRGLLGDCEIFTKARCELYWRWLCRGGTGSWISWDMGHRPSVSRGHCTASTHCQTSLDTADQRRVRMIDNAWYSPPAWDIVTPPFGHSQQHTHCTYSEHFAQAGIFTSKVCSRCLSYIDSNIEQCSMFIHVGVGACKVLVLHCMSCTPGPCGLQSPEQATNCCTWTHFYTACSIHLAIYCFLYVAHHKKAVLGLYLLKIGEIMWKIQCIPFFKWTFITPDYAWKIQTRKMNIIQSDIWMTALFPFLGYNWQLQIALLLPTHYSCAFAHSLDITSPQRCGLQLSSI